MTSRRSGIVVLIGLAAVLALAGAREWSRRWLVGVDVTAVVLGRSVREEKHPGRDDRCFLRVRGADGEREIEVACAVLAQAADGADLRAARESSRRAATGLPGLLFALVASIAIPLALALPVLRGDAAADDARR